MPESEGHATPKKPNWVDSLLANSPNQDPLAEPLVALSTDLSEITAAVQNIEGRYVAKFERAIGELRDALRQQMTDELKKQYDVELRKGIEIVREEFNKRLEKARAGWEGAQGPATPISTATEPSGAGSGDLLEELRRAELQLQQNAEELGAMMNRSDVELGVLIRKKSEQKELENYIRGLRFASRLS